MTRSTKPSKVTKVGKWQSQALSPALLVTKARVPTHSATPPPPPPPVQQATRCLSKFLPTKVQPSLGNCFKLCDTSFYLILPKYDEHFKPKIAHYMALSCKYYSLLKSVPTLPVSCLSIQTMNVCL